MSGIADAHGKNELKDQLNADGKIKELFESAVVKYEDHSAYSIQKGDHDVTGSVVTIDSYDRLLAHLNAYGG